MASRQRSRHPFLLLLAFSLLLLAPVLSTVAQVGPPVRTSPTQAPTATMAALQANPTDEPDLPIRANPTQAPTRAPIDDVVANPTREPTREPLDDVVANPTERPTREPIDDVVANPTEAPAVDDEAIATTGTVRVVKLDCPLGVVEDAFLTDYLTICTQQHDGVEFVLNDVNGAQLGTTAGGQVEWMGVDPGVFNITETLPVGYGDPIVFCGYTESPGGGVQHPSRMDATGGIVEGTFPDAMFEFVCYWMNIKETGQVIPGADDIAIAEGDRTATFLLFKHVCPSDIPPSQDAAYYLEHCTEVLDGIPFTVSHGNGGSTKTTTGGEAEWDGIPLGPFPVDEDLPVQFGEPIVFCGWTAIHEGIVYDAFSQQIPAPGGTAELEVTVPGAAHFCYYFNVKGAGDLVDPSSVANTLLVRKWVCPDGTSTNQRDRGYYFEHCRLMLEPVDFTLANTDGDDTKSTQGGYAEWIGLPLGEFTLTETIPSGHTAPVWFCGWYAEWGGYHYDAFPQLVILAVHNVYEGEITIPNTDWFCDVFNIEGEIDDLVANPTEAPRIDDITANPTAAPGIDDFQGNATTGIVRLEKRNCPPGVPLNATLADYLTICTRLHDGVGFSLETSSGIETGTTAMGEVAWTGVPAGTFEIQETVPADYGDPIVFCGYAESPGGGVQHPSQQSATGGLVEGAFPETAFEFVCYWMNVPNETGFGGPDRVADPGAAQPGEVVVNVWTCPQGTLLDGHGAWDYLGECHGTLDGLGFTLTYGNGNATKPLIDGMAEWVSLPLGAVSLQGPTPVQFLEPIVFCGRFAGSDDEVYESFQGADPSPGGLVELQLTATEPDHVCYWFFVQAGPDSYVNPEDLSNTLVARAWFCPAGVEEGQVMDYYLEQCQLAGSAVDFSLTNDDGVSAQATSGGKVQWDDVPLGPFTIQETIPAGYAEPIVFCGGTAFFMGAVYDDFHKIVPSTGGLVEGALTVPNTHHLCHFFNAGVAIDDLQANPTEVSGIDDVVANPTAVPGEEIDDVTANPGPASLTISLAECQSDSIPGDDIYSEDVEFFSEWCDGSTTEFEFTVSSDGGFAESQTTSSFGVTFAAVPIGAITIAETIPTGWDEPMALCWSDQVDPAGWHIGNDVAWNVASGEQIECLWVNVTGSVAPFVRADATLCPPGFDTDVSWMDVFQGCTLPIDGVEFTFTDANGSST